MSTVATADFIATVARAARVFAPFDPEYAERCRDAALRAWDFVAAQDREIPAPREGYTGSYQSGAADDLMWASAELWETTGDEKFLTEFETRSEAFGVATNWDWPELQTLGFFTYVDSTREGRNAERLEKVKEQIISRADEMASAAEAHAYGRPFDNLYYWGINGVVARTVIGMIEAHRLTGDDKYLDAASLQLDHLLGRNYYGRSFMTGVGFDPPVQPHHRPSVADGVLPPWPGLLIGGPSQGGATNAATYWQDKSDDYYTNEVAVNWNAAMTYALAAFLP